MTGGVYTPAAVGIPVGRLLQMVGRKPRSIQPVTFQTVLDSMGPKSEYAALE
jgi:hypothetical protein